MPMAMRVMMGAMMASRLVMIHLMPWMVATSGIVLPSGIGPATHFSSIEYQVLVRP